MFSNAWKGRVRKEDSRKEPHNVQETFFHAASVVVVVVVASFKL